MKYFAYGANINQKRFQLRCPDSQFVTPIILDNYQFFINSRGVSSIQKKENSFVEGVVWEISKEDAFLLDLYEGVSSGFYFKDKIIFPNIGETLVYISTDYTPGFSRDGYLTDIIDNAIKLDFKLEYVNYLKSL